MSAPGRLVTYVVVDRDGELRGQLDPFPVPTPWWQDLEPLRAAYPQLVVLRLLHAPAGQLNGGEVTYLVQAERPPAGLRRYDGPAAPLAEHPLRMPWARPGGPAADLAWAAAHVHLAGEPEQVRSWNLSSIWRLPTADGEVWLKCVPPFFGHEPAVLRALAPSPSVPRLLAADSHRMLLAAMPGADGYGATPAEYEEVLACLVRLQQQVRPALASLAPVLPDWRNAAFGEQASAVVARRAPDSPALRRLVDGWGRRMSAVAECGLPDVLFHGDVHPGNARTGVQPPVVFDWGDSGFGHPLLDLAVLDRYQVPAARRLRAYWLGRWRQAVPGSDPERAWALLEPVAALRGAVVFQRFLDAIEPSERVYHAGDVTPYLAAAERLAGSDA